MSKTKFKDNCSRCAKAWNCYSRDDCKFEELNLDRVFDEPFDDDKERPFQNIGLDGSPDDDKVLPFDFSENIFLRGSDCWTKEDDVVYETD